MTSFRPSLRLAAVALILTLAGCTIDDPKAADLPTTEASTSTSSSSSSADAGAPVTVPGRPSTEAATSAPSDSSEATVPAETDEPVGTSAATTDVTDSGSTVGTTLGITSVPTTAPTTAPTSGAVDPVTSTSSSSVTTSAAGQVISVQLTGCDGCTVIGSKASVAGAYSAALISRGGRGALVSVTSDGAVRGVVNIPYGSSFPAPAQGLLPCDDDGRCVVTAEQGGTAVLSAFSLDGNGQWTDLSGDGGYPSTTAKGGPITVNGSLGLAVQESESGAPIWMVLAWNGERYAVLGCAPDGPVPAAGGLDPALCGS
ncbi:hypothetical protein D1871_20795 [Nakamurella silvestris]|nr:hypothetical protein D1871_20795 [Nakamurella silvestris]